MARSVQVGDKAPDFTLPSQSGEPVRLQDRLGERVVVLYFYPKATPAAAPPKPARSATAMRPSPMPAPR